MRSMSSYPHAGRRQRRALGAVAGVYSKGGYFMLQYWDDHCPNASIGDLMAKKAFAE